MKSEMWKWKYIQAQMLRTNLWTFGMQNVCGIKKWNHEKLPLNFAKQFPFPFLVIPGNNNVSFPFPKFGNGIYIPVPVPKKWEWNFHSRSRSQKLGMKFFIPVPKIWEWAEPFPFPFPNVQKSFSLTPATQLIFTKVCHWRTSGPIDRTPGLPGSDKN